MKNALAIVFGLAAMTTGAQACDWTGTYSSTFGPLLLQQDADALIGDYVKQNGAFAGRVEGCRLEGVFLNERSGQFGPIAFRLDGSGPTLLDGKWGNPGSPALSGWAGQIQAQLPPQLISNSCAWTGKWLSNFGEVQLRSTGRQVSGAVRGQRLEATWSQGCSLIGVVDFASGRQGFKIDRSGDQMNGTLFPLSGGPVQDWRGQRAGPADPVPAPKSSPYNPAENASAAMTSRTTYRLPAFGKPEHHTDPRYTTNVGFVPSEITSARHSSSQTLMRIRACDQKQVENVTAEAAIRGGTHPGTTHFVRGDRCFLEFDPSQHGEGSYSIDLKVSATDKVNGARVDGENRLTVDYKVVWIAVLGDSFTSGEGAPLKPVDHLENRPERARWQHAAERVVIAPGHPTNPINPHCNVSPRAWPMKTAEILAQRFPDTVFKLSNFACSGTVISEDGDLVKMSIQTEDEYGQKWRSGRFSQLGHFQNAVRNFGRNPDFVFLSAGINNGDFVKVIGAAAAEDLFSDKGKAILMNRSIHLSELRNRYDALNARLMPFVADPSRIVLAAYPDFTRDSSGTEVDCRAFLAAESTPQSIAGTQCDMTLFPNKFGPWNAGFDKLTEIAGAEWKLANRAFAQPLFDQQSFAALRHGWTFAGNTAQLFRGRGICAAAAIREMNQPCDSVRRQGQLQGAFHPNAKGHERVANYIASLIQVNPM